MSYYSYCSLLSFACLASSDLLGYHTPYLNYHSWKAYTNETYDQPTSNPHGFSVPLHWQEDVKANLDRDVRLGVLEPVPTREPVTWCHRMVICAKKNGKQGQSTSNPSMPMPPGKHTTLSHPYTRQERSLKRRNLLCRMEQYSQCTPPPRGQTLHHVLLLGPLHKSTLPLVMATGDMTRSLASIPNKTKCVNDTLLWSEESFYQACNWMDICGKHGITLNPEKQRHRGICRL